LFVEKQYTHQAMFGVHKENAQLLEQALQKKTFNSYLANTVIAGHKTQSNN
jgi:20S proteasome alpha/beta subunit